MPLWAQAYLEALHATRAVRTDPGGGSAPLAVVTAPRIAPRAADQVLRFAAAYAPEAAAGVVDLTGLRRFAGPEVDALDAPPPAGRRAGRATPHLPTGSTGLFSDLNQWLLKLLLAPELPERLLAAPRDRYGSAAQLARAAGVSAMSASRFVRQMEREGHLDPDAAALVPVRRAELMRRWQAAAELRAPREAPMRYLLPGDPAADLGRVLRDAPGGLADGRACLALFAAADALGLGFVDGVPPHVYVPRLDRATLAAWSHLVPAGPGEPPDVILRQAPAPRSIFGGAVGTTPRNARAPAGGVLTCDVVQVWLDVAAHPARGREQADLIRRRVLAPLFDGSFDGPSDAPPIAQFDALSTGG